MPDQEASRPDRLQPENLAEIAGRLVEVKKLIATGNGEIARSRRLMRVVQRLIEPARDE